MSSPTRRLTSHDAQRIATLARLQLSESELDLFARQLTSILEYADSLQAVDTSGVPAYGGDVAGGQWRDDAAVPSLTREDALRNAPSADTDAGTFIVPKVIG
jgi:aspartyl-tRNA(Asn)/glutamyl-tRNA(Gln) amidotransferase subunit C